MPCRNYEIDEQVFFVRRNRVTKGYISDRSEFETRPEGQYCYAVIDENGIAYWWFDACELWSTKEEAEKNFKG